jgi:hypothetical protein
VKAGQCVGDDTQLHLQREAPGRRSTSNQSIEGLSLQVLHGDEVMRAIEPHFVRLDDVGVVETRRETSLVEEHPQKFGIAGERMSEPLDDQEFIEANRTWSDRQKDVTHSALPEFGYVPELPALRVHPFASKLPSIHRLGQHRPLQPKNRHGAPT